MLERLTRVEFLRFLIAGILNTGITYLLFLALQYFMPYQVAYTVVYVMGIVISYGINSIFVFRSRVTIQKALQYPLVYVVQYTLGLALITIFVEHLLIDPAIAALLNVIILLPVSYILTRFILVDKPQPTELN